MAKPVPSSAVGKNNDDEQYNTTDWRFQPHASVGIMCSRHRLPTRQSTLLETRDDTYRYLSLKNPVG
jgi:hypothetical protein